MERDWIIWRIIFWAGIAIILALATLDSFTKKRFTLQKWILFFVLFMAFCFLLGNIGFVTYGQRWLIQGQIIDRDSKQPIQSAIVVSICHKPAEWNRKLLDDQFIELKKEIASDANTSSSQVYGITDQTGHFIRSVAYMSGKVPFGFPFWGSLNKKYAWLVIRKDGYQSAILKLYTRKWRKAEYGSEPTSATINDISVVYLSRIQR